MKIHIHSSKNKLTILKSVLIVVTLVLGCSASLGEVHAKTEGLLEFEPKDVLGFDGLGVERAGANASYEPAYFFPENPITDYSKLEVLSDDKKFKGEAPFEYENVIITGGLIPPGSLGPFGTYPRAHITSPGAGVDLEMFDNDGKFTTFNDAKLDLDGPSLLYLPASELNHNKKVGGSYATYKGKQLDVYVDVDRVLYTKKTEGNMAPYELTQPALIPRNGVYFHLTPTIAPPPPPYYSGFDIQFTCVDPDTNQIVDGDVVYHFTTEGPANLTFRDSDIKNILLFEDALNSYNYETRNNFTTISANTKELSSSKMESVGFLAKNGIKFRFEGEPMLIRDRYPMFTYLRLIEELLDIDYFTTPILKGEVEEDELVAKYTVEQELSNYFGYRYNWPLTWTFSTSPLFQIGTTPAQLQKQFIVRDKDGRNISSLLTYELTENQVSISVPDAVLKPLANSSLNFELAIPVNEDAENLTDYLKNGYLEIPLKVANNDHPTESEAIAKVKYTPLSEPVIEAKLNVAPSSINVGGSAVYTAEIDNTVEPSLPWNWTNAIYKTSPFPEGVTPDLTSIKINGTAAIGNFDKSSRILSVALGDNLSSATEVSYTVSTAENVPEQTVTQQATVTASEGTATTNQVDLIIKGLLKIASAPTNLNFGNLKFDYKSQTISNPEYNEALVVSDTRGASGNGWKLYAKASVPMTHETDESSVLVDALRYVSNGEELILSEGNQLIDQSATSVAKNISDTWGNQPTSDGVKLVVDPENSKVVVGAYKGQITWQLMQGEP